MLKRQVISRGDRPGLLQPDGLGRPASSEARRNHAGLAAAVRGTSFFHVFMFFFGESDSWAEPVQVL